MIQAPGFLLTILAYALVIAPLVFVHEMGHYLAGRLFGIKAEAFSIGFGREVAGWTDKRGTRWKIGWLPLGGYVRFAGDMNPASQPSAEWLTMPAAERQRTFQAKPVWQRAIVVAAGPFINFAAAALILMGFALAYGDVRTPAVVGGTMPGSAAARAGLVAGDRITAIGGRAVATFDDLYWYVKLRPRETVTIGLVRGGHQWEQPITIGVTRLVDNFGNRSELGLLGISPTAPRIVPVGVAEAPVVAVRRVGAIIRMTADTLGQLVTGQRSLDELRGPVGMAHAAGEQLTLGWDAFIGLVALVSINLGFINLLPVPMLDGGHLLFYAIEAVRRRPVTPAVQDWAFRGGLAAILALMLMVTINDLGSLGLWRSLAGLIG